MPSSDDAFALNKRAFQEILEISGIAIENRFGQRATCIASAVKFESSLELSGQINTASVSVTMLAEDFDTLFNPLVLNNTTCRLPDQEATNQLMTIVQVERDEVDPCVNFYAIRSV